MPNLDDAVSEPVSAAPPATLQRASGRFRRSWDVLAVPLLMLASLPLAWLAPHSLVPITHPGTFDDHWVLDATYKVTHGIYFGRDVAFLYGPLAHWLMAVPPRLAGFSLGHIYTSYRTLLLWCAIVFTYFAVRLLIPEQPAWKRFLLVLLLGIFWTSWDGRTALGIVLFVLFLRSWYKVRLPGPGYKGDSSRRRLDGQVFPLVFGSGSALLCAAAFWYSADTGVYGVAGWLIAFAGVAWEGRRERAAFRSYIVALAAFAASSVVLIFLINAVIGRVLDFRFWRTSLALVSVHRWNEPAGMSDAAATHLLVPLLVGCVVFLVRLAVRADRDAVFTARTGFLLSAFAFSLLSMQSGLVRSDYNHIVAGVYPVVLFSGAILFSFTSQAASALAAVAAVAASLLLVEPPAIFQPANIRTRLALMRHPMTSCPGGYVEFDGACYPAEFAETLQPTVNYLQQHSGQRDPVLIFPYQYMFAVAAHRDVAGGVEQSFLANGGYLSQFDIAAMQHAHAPVGLYVRDAAPSELTSFTLSLPIDDISNFTRTPDVWLWIFRHYRADDQQLASGMTALLRDDVRASKLTMQATPLALPARTYAIDGANATIDLGALQWPVNDADFLRLRMKVNYGPLWKLRKPESLQLEITRADGSRSLRAFVIEPNVVTDLWFYPWNEADLSRYFAADESRWRSSYRPAITNLRLIVTPLDWFSQTPQSITVESADAIRFGLSQ